LHRTSSAAAAGDGPGPSQAAGLDAGLLKRVSGAADADQALDIVAESLGGAGSGTKSSLDASDCNAIVAAALDRGNVDLALSVFEAMRSGLAQGEACLPLVSSSTFSLQNEIFSVAWVLSLVSNTELQWGAGAGRGRTCGPTRC
jgi:hypothetical protein